MTNAGKISAQHLSPILYVKDFSEAMDYYTDKLLFKRLWDWGNPPDFGAVSMGKVEIFFCLEGQGRPGSWLSIFMDDVDAYFEQIKSLGAEILDHRRIVPGVAGKCSCAIPINMSSASAMELSCENQS